MKKPEIGDCIALDVSPYKPSDFEEENQKEINWYCSTVLEVDGDKYKMKYDDSWYTFKRFDKPVNSTRGNWKVYRAIPTINL